MWRVLLFLFLLPVEIYAALPPPIQHNAWTTNVSPNDRISGDATTPGGSSLALTLKNTGTAGQYTKTTFDAQGRETSGTTLSASDIPDLSGTYILSLVGQGTNTTVRSNLTVNVTSKDSFILHGTSGGPGLAFDFQQSLVRASNSVTLDTIWFNNGLQLGNTFGAAVIQLATDIGRVTATSFSGDGSLLTALNASQATSGTLPAARLPALTGAITTSAGSAATSLGSFSSANLSTALTDETGSGSAVFGTAPTIAGGSITALTTFGLRDTSAAFDLTLAAVSGTALTAGRTLTLDMGNVAHTLVFGTTANTITFPNAASGTVPFLNLAQTFSAIQTFSAEVDLTGTTNFVSGQIRCGGNIAYSTNTSGMAPDFTKAYTLVTTNAAFTILAPTGVDTAKVLDQTTVFMVTNSTAAVVNIIPPANAHTNGVWNVTNLTVITFFCHGGTGFTNATALPIF